MKHKEGTFTGARNESLFYQSWQPETDARATLIIVHGLGEHSGRYQNVVNHLVPKGYAIYGFDHRGHGRSPGARGFIESFEAVRGDISTFLEMVKGEEGKRPLFLMGHSMGGLITLNYVLHNPEGYQGVIISAAPVGKLDIPPVLAMLSRLLSGILPKLGVDNGLDLDGISRETAVIEAYKADPLVHSKGTPRLGVEMMDNALWTMAYAAEWKPPLLMLHGDADRLVPDSGTREFFEKVTQTDKKLIIYEGGYHESHNDIHREQFFTDLESWLEAHL